MRALMMDVQMTIAAIARRAQTLSGRRAVIAHDAGGEIRRGSWGETIDRARSIAVALAELGVKPDSIHVEIFNGGESRTPGVAAAETKPPHRPPADLETGPLVSFARGGIGAHWNPSAYGSLLELAEACDVPVRWACRTGVCHSCESGLVSGEVAYQPEPLDLPATGNLLICCSRPVGDVVVDL